MIALGITSPQDRDAVKAWVDGNADRDKAKTVYESFARLPVGEGWIWAPNHDLLKQVKFPQIFRGQVFLVGAGPVHQCGLVGFAGSGSLCDFK